MEGRKRSGTKESATGKKRGASRPLLPLLLDPEFIGRGHDPITGKSYQKFKLKNMDILGIPYEVAQLDFGDYIIVTCDDDGVPIVDIWLRKTMSDLVMSFTKITSKGKTHIDEEVKKAVNGLKYYENARITLVIEDYLNCWFDYTDDGPCLCIPFRISRSDKKDRNNHSLFSFGGFSNRFINPDAIFAKIESIKQKGINIFYGGGARHLYKHLVDLLTKESGLDDKRQKLKAIRRKPSHMDPNEKQEFIIQGIEDVGPGMSMRILEDTPVLIDFFNKIANAKSSDDVDIKGIGPVTFTDIKTILTRKYEKDWRLKKKDESPMSTPTSELST